MIKILLNTTKERFFRSFQKKIPHASLFSRFTLSEETEIRGKRNGDRFFLYLHKKGFFSFFSPTLYGKVMRIGEKECLSCRIGRPMGAGLILFLWCCALLFTGALLLPTEPFFALYFLLPGVLFLLPLFLISKKGKAVLLEKVKHLAGHSCKEDEVVIQ